MAGEGGGTWRGGLEEGFYPRATGTTHGGDGERLGLGRGGLQIDGAGLGRLDSEGAPQMKGLLWKSR